MAVRSRGELRLGTFAGACALLGLLGGVCHWRSGRSTSLRADAFGAEVDDISKAPARMLKLTQAQEKTDMDKMTSMALSAANEVLAKIVVPKLNKLIPEKIKEKGDDPMKKVVDSKKLQVSNLAGLTYFHIEKITATSLHGSTDFLKGVSETVTANMELTATVTQPMTATGTFQIGNGGAGGSGGGGGAASEEEPHHWWRRRLSFFGNFKKMAHAGMHSLEDASGTYTMKLTKVNIKMPMVGTLEINAGSDLTNVKEVMAKMKHLTIKEVTNSQPHVSIHIGLQCSPIDLNCHTANAALYAGKPIINKIIGEHAETIVQNILDKALPLTLGEKNKDKASGTACGQVNVATGAPHGNAPPPPVSTGAPPPPGRRLQGATTNESETSLATPNESGETSLTMANTTLHEPELRDLYYAGADTTLSGALKLVIADLAQVELEEIIMEISRNEDVINANYSIKANAEDDEDVFDKTYGLLTPTTDELTALMLLKFEEVMSEDAGSGRRLGPAGEVHLFAGRAPYDFNVTHHAVKVQDAKVVPWRTVPWSILAIAAVGVLFSFVSVWYLSILTNQASADGKVEDKKKKSTPLNTVSPKDSPLNQMTKPPSAQNLQKPSPPLQPMPTQARDGVAAAAGHPQLPLPTRQVSAQVSAQGSARAFSLTPGRQAGPVAGVASVTYAQMPGAASLSPQQSQRMVSGAQQMHSYQQIAPVTSGYYPGVAPVSPVAAYGVQQVMPVSPTRQGSSPQMW